MLGNSIFNDKKLSNTTTSEIELSKEEILKDFELCCISREASIIARREVLTGKAKFGVTGDGKELPQIAMARAFQKGDFHSGYYREQTFMFARGISSLEDYFAQLYADPFADPFSGGRQMNNHFATPAIDTKGEWTSHRDLNNVSAGISSTAGQVARALGLALASKKYRASKTLTDSTIFSNHGNEVTFCTIGDASTSEGIFWEALNAAGVQRVPLVMSVWDDGYGISVPKKYQTTKGSISAALNGLKLDEHGQGIDIYVAKGWDYPQLVDLYQKAIKKVRKTHIPALIHIEEVTQPQGHSTSGSHERYKSKERLAWEKEYDCNLQMERWIINTGIATKEECEAIHKKVKKYARECRNRAWKKYNAPIKQKLLSLQAIYARIPEDNPEIKSIKEEIKTLINPLTSELVQNARRLYYTMLGQHAPEVQSLKNWIEQEEASADKHYHTHLYSTSPKSALNVPVVPPSFSESSLIKNGYQILNTYFDHALTKYSNLFAFGEDVGDIGDVNQGFAGMQKKYGKERVFDTGIREWSIMGYAIGMAMRGLRPIAEIQYLDYLIYGLEPLTDDLATLRFRTNGIQQAPAIIRTRGHRLEGIWHAGSPLGMIINALRGMYVLVPRNMTQAAGFYNTMLQSDDPALIIEVLNGYRHKERMPDNIGEYTIPLGVPEILQQGTDVTLVTYGACVRVAEEGIRLLAKHGISVELIDVQTLLPFDLEHQIVESLKKTNRIVFMDEDVPSGASTFMMQKVLEEQKGYRYLDSPPVTLTASEHRSPYGSDGDYFSKPNPENVFEKVYNLMYEAEPNRFMGKL